MDICYFLRWRASTCKRMILRTVRLSPVLMPVLIQPTRSAQAKLWPRAGGATLVFCSLRRGTMESSRHGHGRLRFWGSLFGERRVQHFEQEIGVGHCQA